MRVPSLALLALLATGGCAAATGAPAPVGRLVLLSEAAGGGVRFLGSAACGTCHPAVYARWRTTAHAREFAGLAGDDRDDPACLRCHVTGYGDPLGFPGAAGTPDLATVGCEVCHGAGADHAGSAYPALVPTASGGACPPCEINKICRLCHTPVHSAGFELTPALHLISCRP